MEESARRVGAPKEHRTVSRVTTILETVAADPHGVRLGVLAGVLDAPKTSVHGLVKGLVATGYLRELDGAYVLGPAVSALLAPSRPPLIDTARPTMRRLQERFDETVMLATLVGDSVVYLDTIESTQLVRYSAPLRTRRPIYPTSSGKCLLAHMNPSARAAYVHARFPEQAARDRVERELDRVVADGVAYNRGETVPDVSAVAAVVLPPQGATAAIAVAGPTSRIADRLDAMADAVREAAREITLQVH